MAQQIRSETEKFAKPAGIKGDDRIGVDPESAERIAEHPLPILEI
jgi:hypothetical protein